MIVRNVPQMSFIAVPMFLVSKETTTIVTRGESQESWGMIERVEKGKRLVRKAPMTLSYEQVVIWLVEDVIRFSGKAVSLANLQSMPVLYPFVLEQPLAYAVSSSKKLELRSEGVGGQFVALRD